MRAHSELHTVVPRWVRVAARRGSRLAVSAWLACACRANEPRDAMTDDGQGLNPTPKPTGLDAAPPDASGSGLPTSTDRLSRERANWPMPNSKNLPLPHPARLERETSDGGTLEEVRDVVTGLVWSQSTSELVDFDAAVAFCAELGVTSKLPFRVPTRVELVSLIDRSYTPTIDPIFGATPADYFWTMSPAPGQDALRFSVYFGVGETAWGPQAGSRAFTRCVHAGARAALPEYRVGATPGVDPGAEVVTATAGDLVWQRSTSNSALTLEAARLYCSTLTLAGQSARLPTPKELQTLVDPSADGDEALWPTLFPAAKGTEFWADEGDTLAPMRVDFATGFTGIADVSDKYHARCVR